MEDPDSNVPSKMKSSRISSGMATSRKGLGVKRRTETPKHFEGGDKGMKRVKIKQENLDSEEVVGVQKALSLI